jgi:hypothetical protein
LVLQDELMVRGDRLIERRVKAAQFRELRTLDQFDGSFNPSIHKKQIFDLATCRFIRAPAAVKFAKPHQPCAPEAIARNRMLSV